MSHGPAPRPAAGRFAAAGALLGTIAALTAVVVLAVAFASLRDAPAGQSPTAGQATATAAPNAAAVAAALFLYPAPRAAPPIALIDAGTRQVSLASLRGQQVLVFFGYTHCPDVCPATIGIIGQVLAAAGPGTRALFVSIDPERDTPAWLASYSPFLPAGLTALTGTAAEIRATAQAWGVRYARVEAGRPDAYSMSHTASVFLVDAAGVLRGDFPFGTGSDVMIAAVNLVRGSPATAVATSAPGITVAAPPPSAPSWPPAGSPGIATPTTMQPEVVSTSVWAESQSPVILALNTAAGRLADPSLRVVVTLENAGGVAGPAVEAPPVRPPGEQRVLYMAVLAIPSPGTWLLHVTATGAPGTFEGFVDVQALDPGSTPRIGSLAPGVATPTLADAGGVARAVTTDPQPDLRLSSVSTAAALAAHESFVLVIDSPRFRVSPACGKAVIMARYLADRWPRVAFIHLEPYTYTLVADTPVLSGTLADPPLTAIAGAWGAAGAPWGSRSMPWVFVVDSGGIVRAKYQGLVGSDDVDIVLAVLSGDQAPQ